MFKAMFEGENGPTVILGFSYANVDRLRDDEPIMFPFADIGIARDESVVILYQHTDGGCALPRNMPKAFVMALADDMLDSLLSGIKEVTLDGIRFVMFSDKDEQTIHSKLKQFIGPQTKGKSTGFAPSDVPVSDN